MSRRSLATLLWWLAAGALLAGQPLTHLTGVIRDPSEAAVPGAVISVVNEETGFRRLALSQSGGGYVVASLQPGVYRLTVRKEGFRTMARFGIHLEAGEPARADFQLSLGGVQEFITVEGSPPVLSREDASVGTLVRREQIEHVPLNGHGLLSLIELTPGAIVTPATRGEAGQFTVSGQRPNTNYFLVDGAGANTGVSVGGLPAQCTGGSLPGMTAFGTFHSLIPLEALEESRVDTSTTVPEYGRLPGAQVSLRSRSGSNEFRGSLFAGARLSALDANDWFANRSGESGSGLRLADFGASLGGPLKRNRTFFFLSYEGMRLHQPLAWLQAVPSTEFRQSAPDWVKPALDLFPTANGADLGNGLAEWTELSRRPSGLDVGSLRLDHALTGRIAIFARYNQAPSSNRFGSTQVGELRVRSRNLTAGANVLLKSNAVLDLRLNSSTARASSSWNQTSAAATACGLASVMSRFSAILDPCNYFLRFSITGVGQILSGSESDNQQDQQLMTGTADLTFGAHHLRLGLDYRHLRLTRWDPSGRLSLIADTLNDLISSQNLWSSTSSAQRVRKGLDELSLFAQDAWRIGQNLTLSYGLRWEFSPAPPPGAALYAYSSEKSALTQVKEDLWPLVYTNFAPRLGLAYRPGHNGLTVVRLGAGLYYDSSLSIATDLINDGPLNMSQYSSGRYPPLSMLMAYGYNPDLHLPTVRQWNASVEHALRDQDTISLSYVGAAGRSLVRREVGGIGNSDLVWLATTTNHGASRYHGLQAQYRRRMGRSLQALASYSWAHSIDNSSVDSGLHWAGSGVTPAQDRGSSDFDARHTFTAALTYQIQPNPAASGLDRWWRGWALDGVVRARTGFPVNPLDAETYMGVNLSDAFRPDVVPGTPIWIADANAAGGRRLNRSAFETPADGVQGNLGRNVISGFGMSQVDLALRRDFTVDERHSLQLRVEAFNALNHANFADPARILANPLFGQSSSMLNQMLGTGSPGSGVAPMFQAGGARSIQISIRLRF
jgi:hypothetical protein